jgi:magnesium transporter
MLRYNKQKKSVEKIDSFQIPNQEEIVWFHFDKTNEFPQLLSELEIHPLAFKLFNDYSDIPKVNIFKNEAVISLFLIKDDLQTVRMTILVNNQLVLSHIEDNHKIDFSNLKKTFIDNPKFMEQTGFLLYHLIIQVSEKFLTSIDLIADEIQALERRVFKDPFENEIGQKVYRWKTKLHELRQIVEPQENVIKMLAHSDFPFADEDSGFYFQDLKESYSRVTSAFDTFKENLNSIFNLQISLKSDHTNTIMKTLTLVSVVFIPMTFIAGLYGMNFEYMPELKIRYGYFYALSVMACIGLSIVTYFRIKGWWGKKNK